MAELTATTLRTIDKALGRAQIPYDQRREILAYLTDKSEPTETMYGPVHKNTPANLRTKLRTQTRKYKAAANGRGKAPRQMGVNALKSVRSERSKNRAKTKRNARSKKEKKGDSANLLF